CWLESLAHGGYLGQPGCKLSMHFWLSSALRLQDRSGPASLNRGRPVSPRRARYAPSYTAILEQGRIRVGPEWPGCLGGPGAGVLAGLAPHLRAQRAISGQDGHEMKPLMIVLNEEPVLAVPDEGPVDVAVGRDRRDAPGGTL